MKVVIPSLYPASLLIRVAEGRDLRALGHMHNVKCSIVTDGGTFIEVNGIESNLLAFADQIAVRESVGNSFGLIFYGI